LLVCFPAIHIAKYKKVVEKTNITTLKAFRKERLFCCPEVNQKWTIRILITTTVTRATNFFYRIPRKLVTGERFKQLSTDAKLLYGLLLDRMGLSAKNGWYDSANVIKLSDLRARYGVSGP